MVTTETKICTKCHIEKPADIEHFHKNGDSPDGLSTVCKDCKNKYCSDHYLDNIDEYKRRNKLYRDGHKEDKKRRDLNNKYGITKEQYDRMFEDQKGVCAICKKPETTMIRGIRLMLAVDHDHVTGKVRGLLCAECNKAVGIIEKYTAIVASYLNRI